MPWPLRGPDETARTAHRTWLRRGSRVAARRSRAAEKDAGNRLRRQHVAWPICTDHGRLPPGAERAGYVEGQNVSFEYRWAEGHYDRLPALFADLVALKVDAIFAGGGLPGALAAKNATSTIPIVFVQGGDPVRQGLAASLAHPRGNLTGISIQVGE